MSAKDAALECAQRCIDWAERRGETGKDGPLDTFEWRVWEALEKYWRESLQAVYSEARARRQK